MTVQLRTVTAEDAAALAAVRELFTEYAEWLAPFVDHTTIAEELASLPEPFAPPRGVLLLAGDGDVACGCVGLKAHTETDCEIKRLFVREGWRETGLGRALFAAALAAACELGYDFALVSTIPTHMPRALAMYERLGFVPTEQFERHTHAEIGLSYLRLDLHAYCEGRSADSGDDLES